jgi:hypothetical protein
MALNWYLTLRNLAKADETAAELFESLKKAETDEEKEIAKQNAQNYIEQKNSNGGDSDDSKAETEIQETPIVEEDTGHVESDSPVPDSDDLVADSEDKLQKDSERDTDQEKIITDLSQPAFTPRLAKCGITREEELFLNGVFVRKMTREEKMLMRRSIYQKKTQRNAQIQAEYKAKRLAAKQKDLNDPEKIKYHQERKLISAVVDALVNHKNMIYIFSEIEGITPDILKGLLEKPENRNAINQANPKFLENFKKVYGE